MLPTWAISTKSGRASYPPTPDINPHAKSDPDAIRVRLLSNQDRADMDLTAKLHDMYIMVFVCVKKNYIHLELSKSRKKADLLSTFARGMEFFHNHGVHPRVIRMDNEISNDFRDMLRAQQLELDLVPPHSHRRNTAERCIRTAKNHLIAIMATAHPDFPLDGIKRLAEQAEITLNLLRASPTAPVTAWEDMYGRPYDFNRHPIGPQGTKVVIHDKTRGTWAPHGLDGYYVGPVMDGYRNARVYVPATRSTRDTDTLSWHFHTLETATNCTDTRLAAPVKATQRAIEAMHACDITPKTRPAFHTAATDLARVTTTLKSHLRTPPEVVMHAIPPVLARAADMPGHHEQRVTVEPPATRSGTRPPEQRVAEQPTTSDTRQSRRPEGGATLDTPAAQAHAAGECRSTPRRTDRPSSPPPISGPPGTRCSRT